MYRLTSDCRNSYLDFASISEAETFLSSRNLCFETVCLVHIATGSVVFTRSYFPTL